MSRTLAQIRPDDQWNEKTSTGPIDIVYGPLVEHFADADVMILRRNASDRHKLVVLSWPVWLRLAATVKAQWEQQCAP